MWRHWNPKACKTQEREQLALSAISLSEDRKQEVAVELATKVYSHY